jgi:hypothetical protein
MTRFDIQTSFAVAICLVGLASTTHAQTAPPAAVPPLPAAAAPLAMPAAKGPAAKGPVPKVAAPNAPATAAGAEGKAAAPSATAAVVVGKALPAKREDCMRLPLSDIAFGREATIAQAQMRLGEYADKEAKKRNWLGHKKSAEVSSCEVYIDFGPLVGTEYKCLVTATFCRK